MTTKLLARPGMANRYLCDNEPPQVVSRWASVQVAEVEWTAQGWCKGHMFWRGSNGAMANSRQALFSSLRLENRSILLSPQ